MTYYLTDLKNIVQKSDSQIPNEVIDNLILCSYIGSYLNGNPSEKSDIDLYGVFIPLQEHVYPKDFIVGYDNPISHRNYQIQGVTYNGKLFDIKLMSILNFCKLCESGSPNQLEILAAPIDSYLYLDFCGKSLKCAYKYYRSKLSIPKFTGTAHSHWTDYVKTDNLKQASEGIRLLLECKDFLLDKYKVNKHSIISDIKFNKFSKTELDTIYYGFKSEIQQLENEINLPEKTDLKMSRLCLKDILFNFYAR